jgi:hypothetical protein
MSVCDAATTARAVTRPAATSNTITTLAELRTFLATDAWPSRGLAVRAGVVALDPRFSATLLRIADGQYMRAARLWLRVANYLDDGEPQVAALSLAAQCAYRGGNHSAARNCFARAEAAAHLHHLVPPKAPEPEST